MPIKKRVRISVQTRYEGEVIPQGISVTEMLGRVHIYIRKGNQIATVKLPKAGWDFKSVPHGMCYEVLNDDVKD